MQFEHGYFSKTMVFPNMVSGAQLVGDTTFTGITDTSTLLPGMVLRNDRTFENILVNTVPSGTSITATRAFGTVAAAAVNAADKWYMVGNAYRRSVAASHGYEHCDGSYHELHANLPQHLGYLWYQRCYGNDCR
jgi:hypothetical protein